MTLAVLLVLALQDPGPRVGQSAPPIKGHDYRGKKAVAVAAGRPETLKEHASLLQDAQKKYQDKLAFVAISFGAFDGLPFPIVNDARSKYLEGLYVVDISGKLAWKSKTFGFDEWEKELVKASTPPTPATSRGSGGPTTAGVQKTPSNFPFELLPPAANGGAVPVLIVFSGVEGKEAMAQNLRQMASMAGMNHHVVAVLDGRQAKASDGVDVLAQLRRWYNVDNDAIKVFTESAGTREGLTFALRLAQSDIAAVWANDPVAVVTPSAGSTAWGSAGAGAKAPRDVQNANAIVAGMKEKTYRTKEPFIDPASGHGTVQGFMEGLKFLKDKRRR